MIDDLLFSCLEGREGEGDSGVVRIGFFNCWGFFKFKGGMGGYRCWCYY